MLSRRYPSPQLTPVAIREGHAFADTVFGKRPVEVDHVNIPTAVFSSPRSHGGMTEAQAARAFSHVDVYKIDFSRSSNAVRARHAGIDEAGYRWLYGPRRRLSYRRRRRGRMIQLLGIAVK